MKAGLPEDAVALVEDTSHETATAFMQLRGFIDCLIPRGGQALIASLVEHATVPYVLDGDGNCHIYIDGAADLAMAHELAVNAKTHRFGVCNAVETILVHAGVAADFLPRLAASLATAGVEIRADDRVRAHVPDAVPALERTSPPSSWGRWWPIGMVDDVGEAIEHIARYSSGHSEAIVTSDVAVADRFVAEVDGAAVLVNASTRFVDGEELGLGPRWGSRPRSCTPADRWE